MRRRPSAFGSGSARQLRCFPLFKVRKFLTLLPSSTGDGRRGKAMSVFTEHNVATLIVFLGLCLYTVSTYLFERE
jgi:hypothetical protein